MSDSDEYTLTQDDCVYQFQCDYDRFMRCFVESYAKMRKQFTQDELWNIYIEFLEHEDYCSMYRDDDEEADQSRISLLLSITKKTLGHLMEFEDSYFTFSRGTKKFK